MGVTVLGWSTTSIATLKPYPGNARRGDVAMIAESMSVLGQYRPVVANRRTKTILAGHHVVKAAQVLGQDTVDVTWVDVDDSTARRIVLADNRLADLADYDLPGLQDLLTSLPDLDGTGFSPDDIANLEDLYGAGGGAGGARETDMGRVHIGPHRYTADPDVMTAWSERMKAQYGTKASAGRALRDLLDIPKPTKAKAKPRDTPQAPPRSLQPVELVDLKALEPYPGNARQGDVGALCESLASLGAYRPIVANRRTGRILVGNHTHAAAGALGWDQVAVWWVDVDEETERKIVVADNRASDLGTYDADALRALLIEAASDDLSGTGFDGDDVDSILNGGPTKPGGSKGRGVTITCADLTCKIERGSFDQWLRTIPEPAFQEFETRLHLPPDTLVGGL